MPKQTHGERQDIIDALDPEVTRVKVKDEFGHNKWRDKDDLHDKDIVILKGDGLPYVMKGKPGRKAAPPLKPVNDSVAEHVRQKQVVLESDAILRTAKGKPSSGEVLDHVLVGLADEAASLSFERTSAEREGKETSHISMRRVSALKAIGDTWLKRKDQLSHTAVDLESASFKKLFSFIMETFRGALSDTGLRPEMIETVFAKLAQRLADEWEDEAKNRMKRD